ncbi:Os03g0270700, partial [Oryza sativa Japonica Group]
TSLSHTPTILLLLLPDLPSLAAAPLLAGRLSLRRALRPASAPEELRPDPGIRRRNLARVPENVTGATAASNQKRLQQGSNRGGGGARQQQHQAGQWRSCHQCCRAGGWLGAGGGGQIPLPTTTTG